MWGGGVDLFYSKHFFSTTVHSYIFYNIIYIEHLKIILLIRWTNDSERI